LPYRIWWALFAGCGLATSWFTYGLFDEEVIAGFFVVALAAVALTHYRLLRKEETRPLRALLVLVILAGGLFLGAILFLVSGLTLFFGDLLTGGRYSELATWAARLGIALFLGAVVLLLARRPRRRGWNYVRLAINGLLIIGIAVALGLLFAYTGPEDLSVYPPPAQSPYRLPWKPGIRRLCCQGNRAIVSHRSRNGETFAYDFAMPIGTEVCAARGGVVTLVTDFRDGNWPGWPNNQIWIRHDDNTSGVYLHFRKEGSRVHVGQRVAQGDVICESGNVGNSLGPHLHFEVRRGGQTIPVTFADVPGDGIPRFLRRYTSGAGLP
jgi:murein DD-endopeptidase MepM/ murein hydrolase activator NlpD